MVWSAGTNGALPAAGRKPVSGFQTKTKDFMRKNLCFLSSSRYFLHCRGSLVSLFYLLFSNIKSVLSCFPKKWLPVNIDTVWSSKIRTLIEFLPPMRLKCTPYLTVFFWGGLPQSCTYTPEIFKWLLIFVYCGHCIALNIFMMFSIVVLFAGVTLWCHVSSFFYVFTQKLVTTLRSAGFDWGSLP